MLRTLALVSILSTGFAYANPAPIGTSARHPIDDSKYDEKLDAAAADAVAKSAFFFPENLAKADARKVVPYAPEKLSDVKPEPGEFFRRAQKSTLMLVAISKKDFEDMIKENDDSPAVAEPKVASRRTGAPAARSGKIHRTSVGGATAFVVNSAAGVVVTCRHALEFDGPFVLVAVTAEGRVIPVKTILLADKLHDLAFLQLDATDLPALPVAPDVDAGEHIRVMSHPSGYYFHMTEGIVARHSRIDPDEEHPDAPRATSVDITADIAEGSSGGAVLDDRGNVVAVAQEYSLAENDDHQTAFKHRGAIPAAVILRHMKATE